MKLLAIGDITGPIGIEHLKKNLWSYRRAEGIDLVIANAENAGFISGPRPAAVEELLAAGVDVITSGNHIFQCYDLWKYLDESDRIVRPLNYPSEAPGKGYVFSEICGYRVLVISALGRSFMEPDLDCPFRAIDRVLDKEAGRYDFALLDFHAEATAEKKAIGYYFDRRIDVIWGTHTHVPTADETILEGGSAYISDIGMCGPQNGVLGLDRDIVLRRFLERLPLKQEPAKGDVRAQGIIVELRFGGGASAIRRCEF